MREPDVFVSTVTEKLLTYALGRGLTAADMPAVRGDRSRRASGTATGSRRSFWGIVRSVPFRCGLDGAAEGQGQAQSALHLAFRPRTETALS
jgi:hypothetical protein